MAGGADTRRPKAPVAVRTREETFGSPLFARLVVNLFGAPGSGKTSLAFLVAGFLKTRYPHFTVECPEECAKGVVYDGALKALNAPLYITGRQWWQVARCAGHADIVVCDSPVLMAEVYGAMCDPPMPEAFGEVCAFHHDMFPSLNLFAQRNHAYEVKARAHNEAESNTIGLRIHNMLGRFRVPYGMVESSEVYAGLIADAAARRAAELKEQDGL